MRFSICIPTHEAGGNGHKYLSELLATLRGQTYKDFEVVVSDHSTNNDILKTCEAYSKDMLIKYVRNFYGRGRISPNINRAISLAEGEIVKIMFMDDLLYSSHALETINDSIEDRVWVACGFTHTKDTVSYHRNMTPRWANYLLEGNNLIGNPSVIAFKREATEFFDDKVDLFMDTDFYHRMRMKHGLPKIIEDTLITIREHDDRVSSNTLYDATFQDDQDGTSWLVNKSELEYLWLKYGNPDERSYPDEE